MLGRLLTFGIMLVAAAPLFHCDTDSHLERTGTEVAAASDGHATAGAITVKLRVGVQRKRSDVMKITDRLKKLSGTEGVTWTPAGRDTIVMSLSAANKPMELKDELLKDVDVHEVDIGPNTYRREGDKPHIELRKELLVEKRKKLRETLADRIKGLLGRKPGGRSPGEEDAAVVDAIGDAPEGSDAQEQQQQRRRRRRRADGRRRRRRQGQLGGGQAEL